MSVEPQSAIGGAEPASAEPDGASDPLRADGVDPAESVTQDEAVAQGEIAGTDETAELPTAVTPTRARRVRRRRPEPEPAPLRPPTRRVVRTVRRVQLWSVFKVAVLSYLVFYGITLLAVAALWSLANSAGQVHHLEKFMRDVGFDNWTFDGGRLFSATALVGAVLVVAGSVFTTLAAALVNLISELTGGIRLVVIESPTAAFDDDLEDPDGPLDDDG